MLYIKSQNGLQISDLRTISVMPPEHDLEEDGSTRCMRRFYKVYVDGSEFARYKDLSTVERVLEDIEKFIHMKDNFCYELPKEGDAT